jgi:hypothetical protein
MTPATGFSCPHVTLAVGLRLALSDYRAAFRPNTSAPLSIVDAIEIPRSRAFVVVLLNAALCEAAINTSLALHFESGAWAQVERKPTVFKWSQLPKQIWPNYSLPDADPRLLELKALFDCRDAIMHAKPEVFDGMVKRHPGNFPGHRKRDYSVIDTSTDLSLRLLDHLGRYDSNAWLHKASIEAELIRA